MLEQSSAPTPVRVSRLSIGYGVKEAVSSISFELTAGRTLAVMGPGGSGKTSLLRALADAEVSGMWIEGELRVTPGAPLCCWQKPVFEARRLDALLLEAAGDSRAKPQDLLDEVWRAVPEAAATLLPWLETSLSEADRDVRALVAFSRLVLRALRGPKALLLIDEPTADVSPPVAQWLRAGLEGLRGRHTLVLVTHDQRLARSVADDVLLLAAGSFVEKAPVEEFFRQPRTARASQFVRMGS